MITVSIACTSVQGIRDLPKEVNHEGFLIGPFKVNNVNSGELTNEMY